MEKSIKINLRKTVGIFGITVIFLAIFNTIMIAETTSGTNPAIYMQNGIINATTVYANNLNGSLPYSNLTGVPNTFPYANLTNTPSLNGPYSYIINASGSTCYMQNGTTGQIDFQSTNVSKINDYVMGNLTTNRTWQETVFWKGNFTTANTLLLPNWVDVKISGAITGASGMTAPIFANKDQATNNYGITIEGEGQDALIIGNGNTQKGISFVCGTDTPNWHTTTYYQNEEYTLKNLDIKNFADDCIHLDFASASSCNIGVSGVSVIGLGEQAVYAKGVCDSYWVGGTVEGLSSSTLGFYLESCSGFNVNPDYMNNCHEFIGCNHIVFSCHFADNTGTGHTLTMEGCCYCMVLNSEFHHGGTSDNTYDAILVTQAWGYVNSTGNVFSGIVFSNQFYTTSFKYGIEETSSWQNYNLFTGLNDLSIDSGDGTLNTACGTGIVRKLGANSKADVDSIIGTIVTS
jgi:hypothetical protein